MKRTGSEFLDASSLVIFLAHLVTPLLLQIIIVFPTSADCRHLSNAGWGLHHAFAAISLKGISEETDMTSGPSFQGIVTVGITTVEKF
jgi:hypothetical protein